MSNSHKPPPGFGAEVESASLPLEIAATSRDEVQSPAGNSRSVDNIGGAVAHIEGQLRIAEQAIEAHRDEIIKIINACKQYEQMLQNLQTQVAALTRREISLGFGVKALEVAAGHKGPGDQPKNVVGFAKEYLQFLMNTLVPAPVAAPISDEAPTESDRLN